MVFVAESGKRTRKSPIAVDFVMDAVHKKTIVKSPRSRESERREMVTYLNGTACEDAQIDIFASFSSLTNRRKSTVPYASKSYWKQSEDDALKKMVGEDGPNKWKSYAKEIPGRTGKQCRERWANHLNPTINKGAFTPEEDAVIARAVDEVGYKWADIAALLPGRTDNLVKNRYNQSVPLFVASKLGQFNYTHDDNETDESSILQALQIRSLWKPQRASRNSWSQDEDDRLTMAVAACTGAEVKWKEISHAVGKRVGIACKRRWNVLYPAGDTSVRVASAPESVESHGGDCYCDDLEESSLEDVMAAYSEDTTYGLLALEKYSEGKSCKGGGYTHSYHMTVGSKGGLNFSYPPQKNTNLVRGNYTDKEKRDVLWYLTPSALQVANSHLPTHTPKPPVVAYVAPHKAAVLQHSLTAYFSEVKWREEAEALAKSVFV